MQRPSQISLFLPHPLQTHLRKVSRCPHGHSRVAHGHSLPKESQFSDSGCEGREREVRRVQGKAGQSLLLVLPDFSRLCGDCEGNHCRKIPHTAHSTHPVSVYESMKSGGEPYDVIRNKQKCMDDLLKRLNDELIHFDAYVRQVETEFETLIAQITAEKEEIRRNSQIQRKKLTDYLDDMHQTIESKRYEKSFQVVTVLEEYIASGYVLTPVPAIEVFTGKMEFQGIYKLVEKCVTYEVVESPLLQILAIPVLKGNSLRLYHRRTLEMTQLTLSQATNIDQNSAYCFIGLNTVLAVGGGCHSEVYEINVHTGKVDRRPNMSSNRGYAGVYPYKGEYVFVFGGYDGSGNYLNTSERYRLSLKSWSNVRNPMQRSKYYSSVCEHASKLYVSGTDNAGSSIECFNPVYETFILLRTDSICVSSILCCLGDELYQVKHNKVEVARLSRGSPVTFTEKALFPQVGNGYYWLCCPLKPQRGELISILNSAGVICGLFSFKPVQGQFMQVATIAY